MLWNCRVWDMLSLRPESTLLRLPLPPPASCALSKHMPMWDSSSLGADIGGPERLNRVDMALAVAEVSRPPHMVVSAGQREGTRGGQGASGLASLLLGELLPLQASSILFSLLLAWPAPASRPKLWTPPAVYCVVSELLPGALAAGPAPTDPVVRAAGRQLAKAP